MIFDFFFPNLFSTPRKPKNLFLGTFCLDTEKSSYQAKIILVFKKEIFKFSLHPQPILPPPFFLGLNRHNRTPLPLLDPPMGPKLIQIVGLC